jgi:hypothetical protein
LSMAFNGIANLKSMACATNLSCLNCGDLCIF